MMISKVAYFWKAHDMRNLKNDFYICTGCWYGFYL